MDWDGPTTKKHIAEAKAQGCVLLGPGRSNAFRNYRLPCGHQQEIQTGMMRRGSFKCRECYIETLHQEARVQGCKLIGPGEDRHYRIYQLPCGHEQEIQIAKLRKGTFRCQICLQERLESEARVQGCELLGPGRNKQYRTYRLNCGHVQQIVTRHMRLGKFNCPDCQSEKYESEAVEKNCKLLGPGSTQRHRRYRLPCGHEQEVRISEMRSGRFACGTCLNKQWHEEARAQGCEWIGQGTESNHRTYRLPCGHIQDVSIEAMRSGRFRCRTCLDAKLIEEARAVECKLLGPGKNRLYRVYRLPCGHEQELTTVNLRNNNFRCATCLELKLQAEAEARQCKILGPGRTRHFLLYKLPCKHEQEVTIQNMREGYFRCQICEEYSYTLPSNAYLLHIKVGSDEWLKLGYASNVEVRASGYGLPPGAEVYPLATRLFPTGLEAVRFEKKLHKKYARNRLAKEEMAYFHRISGANECYPVTMVETLLAHFREQLTHA